MCEDHDIEDEEIYSGEYDCAICSSEICMNGLEGEGAIKFYHTFICSADVHLDGICLDCSKKIWTFLKPMIKDNRKREGIPT